MSETAIINSLIDEISELLWHRLSGRGVDGIACGIDALTRLLGGHICMCRKPGRGELLEGTIQHLTEIVSALSVEH